MTDKKHEFVPCCCEDCHGKEGALCAECHGVHHMGQSPEMVSNEEKDRGE
jgi:hypothetical protein